MDDDSKIKKDRRKFKDTIDFKEKLKDKKEWLRKKE